MGKKFQTMRLVPMITPIILMLLTAQIAKGESWELHPLAGDVLGTEQIEAGDIDAAINMLNLGLENDVGDGRVAIAINLCVAYALKLEYEAAMKFCDQAASDPLAGPTVFNNRGVIRAVIGDARGAARDLKRAACDQGCGPECSADPESALAVAKRNLERLNLVSPELMEDGPLCKGDDRNALVTVTLVLGAVAIWILGRVILRRMRHSNQRISQ